MYACIVAVVHDDVQCLVGAYVGQVSIHTIVHIPYFTCMYVIIKTLSLTP
jgi:hypothetical protein